jgi:hypothetical protein
LFFKIKYVLIWHRNVELTCHSTTRIEMLNLP